ncbi:MAG: N4-bis(aminopropyl)spermidine synthase [Thermovirga sp.]|jgi:predicted methyltransferase|nr:MAG: Uncharacterized protein XD70_0278 [Thermovirga lienii]MDN5318814.1 N4-bis(aminopropyl)spermidine synthase [Thermovirga sp.]HCD71546.1 putative methyltransferase [Thermovirga lienii]
MEIFSAGSSKINKLILGRDDTLNARSKTKAYAEEVALNTKIEVRKRDVERILSAIMNNSNFWKIVQLSEEPVPVVAELIKIMERDGFVAIEGDQIKFTDDGKALCKDEGIEPLHIHSCPTCSGRTVILDESLKEPYDKFLELHVERPEAIRQYDQAYVTPETTFSRIALADSRGDIRNKDVIVLGDDDMVALALAITRLPRRIVMLEIDERIVDFQRRKAKELGLSNLEVRRHDLRKPLPEDLLGQFDVFFCDPPETVAALAAFVGRGVATLRGMGGAGYFGLTSSESSFAKWRRLEQVLLDKGLVITDIIRNFNEYVNWGYAEEMLAWKLAPVKVKPTENWYYSSIFRVEVVNEIPVSNEDLTDSDIYNDAESSTV